MDLATYELEGRHRYGELAKTVGAIIEVVAALAEDYRVQQVQCRAKGVSSLRTKLANRQELDSEAIEVAAKDLAGCRVILYTNADVARFIFSNVIPENFEVDWDRTKFHYPMAEPTAEDGFISYNYVVQLKPERLALPEYAQFAGMSCEVQVQTTLDHAWSEMAHDTIYKPPPAGFGGTVMKSVAERMTEIMQRYLRPAGFEFQKIVADVRALERGRTTLASEPLKRLGECADNNTRHEVLKSFEEHVLPYFDDLPAHAVEIREAVVDAALRARETPTAPWEMHGMKFRGIEPGRVVAMALDVIDTLRFTSPEAVDDTFQALARLYPGAGSDEQNRFNQSVEKLAKHDLRIWEVAGPLVQQRLVELIKSLGEADRVPIRGLLVAVLHQVLKPDLTHVSSTYNTFTFHQGAVVANSEYLGVRRDAIAILEQLFDASADDVEQRNILHALAAAGRLPDRGGLTADLYAATVSDMTSIMEFVTSRAPSLGFELLQSFEHDLLWRYRHNRAVPPALKDEPGLEEARERLQDTILAFRDLINADEEYVIYKTLVGFQSVFPPAWEGDPMDIQGEGVYRTKAIAALVAGMDDKNFSKWLERLRRCAQTKSNDLATFPSFRDFLLELGRAKPALLVRLFDNLDEDLDWFVSSMLQGIEGGPLGDEIGKRTGAWITDRKHLLQIIGYCDVSKALDADLLRRAVSAAIEAGEGRAVAAAMQVSMHRDEDVERGLADLFVAGLNYFAKDQDTSWVNAVWFRASGAGFMAALSDDTRALMLENLVHLGKLDFHAEELLKTAAGDPPLELLEFMHRRVRAESTREAQSEEIGEEYEAVPYDFNGLREPFAKIPAETVSALRAWFDEDEDSFEYRAGALLPRLFPDLVGPQGAVTDLAASGSPRDLKFVLRTLRGYKGEPFVLPICKIIVARLEPADELLHEVDFVLEQSGMIHGEFGFVELNQRRKAEISAWLQDERPNVRAFAERRIRQLDRAIAAEQRRSLEGLELRKREYGE